MQGPYSAAFLKTAPSNEPTPLSGEVRCFNCPLCDPTGAQNAVDIQHIQRLPAKQWWRVYCRCHEREFAARLKVTGDRWQITASDSHDVDPETQALTWNHEKVLAKSRKFLKDYKTAQRKDEIYTSARHSPILQASTPHRIAPCVAA